MWSDESRQQLAEFVALALVRLVARRHPVRLVHDDQVPVHLPQSRQDLVPLGQIQRGDHLRLLHPLVHAELRAELASLQHDERLVELLLQLALPLEREVRRRDDQDPLGEAAQLQLADQQPGHDRLPGAGVVGQQEPYAGQPQQVVVDRLQLVRQRIDTGDRQSEVGIELPSNPERVRLQSQPQQPAVSVVPETAVKNCQSGQLRRAERDPPESFRPRADQTERPTVRPRLRHGFHAHRLVEERAGQDPAFSGGRRGVHRSAWCGAASAMLPPSAGEYSMVRFEIDREPRCYRHSGPASPLVEAHTLLRGRRAPPCTVRPPPYAPGGSVRA